MASFLDKHGLLSSFPELLETVQKAQAVSPLFIRTNGSLPTVGDTELYPKISINELDKEKLGVDCFPDSGFFIYKGPSLHLTAKCGGNSFVHRHVDDTSITLHYSGDDIIIDGGFFSYDTNLRITRYFKSYFAHSGIFTTDSDKMRFINFSNASDIAVISYFCSENDLCMVQMKSHHHENSQVERNLSVQNEENIFIHDIITPKSTTQWRQQFLVSPKCTVSIKPPNSVVVTAANSVWEISQQNVAGISLKLEEAHFSDEFMRSTKTQCIVYYGESEVKHIYTNIRKIA